MVFVPSWRILSYRDVRKRVEARAKEQARAARERATRWLEAWDSASESDAEDPENDWREVEVEDGAAAASYSSRKIWWSPSRNETRDEAPVVRHKFLRSLVGKRMRFLMTNGGTSSSSSSEWIEGTIERYNAKRRKHRVTFDDGNMTRWYGLKGEQRRVQIQHPETGAWIEMRLLDRDWLSTADRDGNEEEEGDTAAIGIAWRACDDGAGNTYYFNTTTGASQWDVPDGSDGRSV